MKPNMSRDTEALISYPSRPPRPRTRRESMLSLNDEREDEVSYTSENSYETELEDAHSRYDDDAHLRYDDEEEHFLDPNRSTSRLQV
eukprot:CAMPEP_0194436422 /NCGR_PEP_ID=MMETSP0176-20130528/94531_1 /TAXON_ID=216777 /ORGANISM="Proboscia alata, Strain PI-D3" /LENGTH=86 /DNA_ID=CAMNT_0039256737 /DNA_START=38 /DNA_END=295 /DNA_ORIENTATION=-